MKAIVAILPIVTSLIFGAVGRSAAQTNLTGIVVDEDGRPIPRVACRVTGWFSPEGGRVHYTGVPQEHLTDVEGRFSISLPRSRLPVEMDFDHWAYAPVFLYDAPPAASPIKVVMTKGRVLNGRIVDEQGAPVGYAEIELQMPQDDFWYQRRGHTDRSGEFHFRISEPAPTHRWCLYYAGKRFTIDYHQVKPESVVELKVNVQMTSKAEPDGPANGSQPIRSETNRTSSAAGSRR